MPFHESKKGVLKPCNAQPGNCPLGGKHYDTLSEGYADIEKRNSEEFGNLGSVTQNVVKNPLKVSNPKLKVFSLTHNSLPEDEFDTSDLFKERFMDLGVDESNARYLGIEMSTLTSLDNQTSNPTVSNEFRSGTITLEVNEDNNIILGGKYVATDDGNFKNMKTGEYLKGEAF